MKAKHKTIIMLLLLAVAFISGWVLHVHHEHHMLVMHMAIAACFTIVATVHAISHSGLHFSPGKPQKTQFIQLDPHKCQACFKCVENCKKQVLGKVDLPFHKHAKVVNPNACIGCKKCVKTCEHSAITEITE